MDSRRKLSDWTFYLVLVLPASGFSADPVHVYDAASPSQSNSSFRDSVGSHHWSLSNVALDTDISSPASRLTAAYRVTSAATGSGGAAPAFPAGDISFEVWVRPAALGSNHQVIFETGGGQNGSSFLITDKSVRFLNSRLNVRNFDLSVPLAGVNVADFIQLVAAVDFTRGRIDLHVRGSAGGHGHASGTGTPGNGSNGASLFNWGSGIASLGGNHNNLGGRSELAGASPTGLTGFNGEIALLRIYDTALSEAQVETRFGEIAGPLPTIHSFTASREEIASGEAVELSWETSNADSLRLEPGVGSVDEHTVDGAGSLTISPAATTVYRLMASDSQISATAAVQVIVDELPLSPEISEFLASNEDVLLDGNAESSDWIEIYNPNLFSVDLNGLYLTDSIDVLDRWRFPPVTLSGDSYLVVFASGRLEPDYVDADGFLHTTFRLSSDGEYLALVSSDGKSILDDYGPVYPPQFKDVSYGRVAEGESGYFPIPSPGEPNGASVSGFTQDTKFSVDRGFFEAPFEVAISCGTEGATIRYTLDGSAPSADASGKAGHGIVYDTPLQISTTTTLRAIAYRSGMAPSNVDTHTYVFLHDVVRQPARPEGFPAVWAGVPADYEMDPDVIGENNLFDDVYRNSILTDLKSLPAVSIVMDREDLFGASGLYQNPQGEGVAWERPGSVELFPADDSPGTREGVQVNCAIRIQGGSSRSPNYPKHSFRLLFKKDYGPGKLRYPLFAEEPGGETATDVFDTVILRAGFNNSWTHWHWFQNPRAQYLRDQWMRDSQRALGWPSPHGRFVHLYLNGLYWGMYNLVERPTAPFMAAYYGGEREDFDTQNVNAARDGDLTAWNTMMGVANGGLASAAAYENIQRYLDINNLTDYMILNFHVGNDDWDGHNWYAGRQRQEGAGYQFFCWDSELIISRHANPPPQPDFDVILNRDRTGLSNNNKPTRLYSQLRVNAEYRLRFADRVQKHYFNDGALSTERILDRWDRRADQIWQALVAESARWGDYRRDVHQGNNNTPDDYDLFHRNEHYLAHREWLFETYFPQRRAIVLQQFRNRGLCPSVEAPVFHQHGGQLTRGFVLEITASTPAIHFTLDGSDPRLSTGEVSPSATAYTGGVPLIQSTVVKARVLNGGEWSALTEAFFYFDLPLRITELMFHPRDPEPGSVYEADDFEFIEMQNIGTEPLDLAGLRLEGGVEFEFQPDFPGLSPGSVVVVAKNVIAFLQRYPIALNLTGVYSGRLSNATDHIRLVGPLGEPVLTFSYSDRWYAETDGLGHSLTIIDPSGDRESWGMAASWQPSPVLDGTPGVVSGDSDGGWQVPGDANQDGGLDISDVVRVLLLLFGDVPLPVPCGGEFLSDKGNVALLDVNGDRGLNIADPIYLLNYLFGGGPMPTLGSRCVRISDCPDVCR